MSASPLPMAGFRSDSHTHALHAPQPRYGWRLRVEPEPRELGDVVRRQRRDETESAAGLGVLQLPGWWCEGAVPPLVVRVGSSSRGPLLEL